MTDCWLNLRHKDLGWYRAYHAANSWQESKYPCLQQWKTVLWSNILCLHPHWLDIWHFLKLEEEKNRPENVWVEGSHTTQVVQCGAMIKLFYCCFFSNGRWNIFLLDLSSMSWLRGYKKILMCPSHWGDHCTLAPTCCHIFVHMQGGTFHHRSWKQQCFINQIMTCF